MAVTQQGKFETTYCHVNAPTHQDKEYWEQNHRYKLLVPRFLAHAEEYLDEVYCHPLVALLAQTEWNVRRKLNGQNIRIYWDGNQALWNGKTDDFSCDTDFTNYMNNTFIEELFEEHFGRDKQVYIFAEKMGPKTQGNELQLDEEQVIIYDVCINGYWLDRHAVECVAEYFKVKTCYDYMGPNLLNRTWMLTDIIRMVATGKIKDWEGIVATPKVECQDREGQRVIVKVKNKDYFREEWENDDSFMRFI